MIVGAGAALLWLGSCLGHDRAASRAGAAPAATRYTAGATPELALAAAPAREAASRAEAEAAPLSPSAAPPHATDVGTAAPAAEPAQVQHPPAGLLTAASVGDADRFENYMSYLNRRRAEEQLFGLRMGQRVRLRVVDAAGRPTADAPLELALPWAWVKGRTHADGTWDFFPSVSFGQGAGAAAQVTVAAGQQLVRTRIELPQGPGTREYLVRLPFEDARLPQQLDLAFMIDITGSMGDELRYVNREVVSIVHRVRAAVPEVSVRVGGVFYRDRGDDPKLLRLPFTSDAQGFSRAMTRIEAGGGGDYPEDMDAALELALHGLDWSAGHAPRVLVIIADAPPQRYADAQYRYPDAMREAAARGIRLLPVAASGWPSTGPSSTSCSTPPASSPPCSGASRALRAASAGTWRCSTRAGASSRRSSCAPLARSRPRPRLHRGGGAAGGLVRGAQGQGQRLAAPGACWAKNPFPLSACLWCAKRSVFGYAPRPFSIKISGRHTWSLVQLSSGRAPPKYATHHASWP
jgi:hypothetical protein